MSINEASVNPLELLDYNIRGRLIANYVAYSKLALLFWEILINLDREIQLVWSTCDSFRWSNVVYYANRYPLLAYQIWIICYTPETPQLLRTLPILLVFLIHPNTRGHFCFVHSTRLCCSRPRFNIRLPLICFWVNSHWHDHFPRYAIFVHPQYVIVRITSYVAFALFYSTNQSVHRFTGPLAGGLGFIALAVFDTLATSLVTVGMTQIIRKSGGFRKLNRQNLCEYVLRSGILYFMYVFLGLDNGSPPSSWAWHCRVVTIPQLIAVVLYFAPHGLYSPIFNNFILVLSSVMVARFLLGLREMRETTPEVAADGTTSLSLLSITDVSFATDQTRSSTTSSRIRPRWWAGDLEGRGGGTSLLTDFAFH